MINVNDMVWSHSRVDAFRKCKYSWYLNYVEHKKQIENAWAMYGQMMHGIIDEWAKGVLLPQELSEEYIRRYYQQVIVPFPRMNGRDMNPKYYQRGLEYFLSFRGFGEQEIVMSERTFKYKYKGLLWTAIIDLLVRNDQGQLILIDHKSFSDSKTKREIKEHADQLYWYMVPIWKYFHEVPTTLNFNLFVRGGWYEEVFDAARFHVVEKQIFQTLEDIAKETEWEPTYNDMFCKNICGYRNICEHCKKHGGTDG
jgi:hypothetical protein